VKDTAKVCGNIYAPSVSINEGANFSGSIDMSGKTSAGAAKSDGALPRMIRTSGSAA
jgi:cytoskeletal protein CcmA (bactofilin family)